MPSNPLPVKHAEAIREILRKPVMSRQIFAGLLPELRARAFVITGIENFDTLQRCRNLVATLPGGGDWEEIQRQLIAEMSPWFTPKQAFHRARILTKVHGFMAYASANYQRLEAMQDVFPYRMWQHGDSKMPRASHLALDGKVLPANSPFWKTHTAPRGYGCNCDVVGITGLDAERFRAQDEKLPPAQRRVLDGPRLEQLEKNGRIEEPDQPGIFRSFPEDDDGFQWEPGSLRMTVKDLKGRYDARTWRDFEDWGKKTVLDSEGRTVMDWLNGAALNDEPADPNGTRRIPAAPLPQPGPVVAGRTAEGIRQQLARFAAESAEIDRLEKIAWAAVMKDDASTAWAAQTEADKIRDKMNDVVSIPVAERGKVNLGNKAHGKRAASKDLMKHVAKGAALAERYTHASLLPSVVVVKLPDKNDRAFYGTASTTINVKEDTRLVTILHEITHGTECQNPSVLKASREFLLKRTAGERVKTLRAITGSMFYRRDEVAFEDDFLRRGNSPYCGKDYGNIATEILTMGMERLHGNAAKFAMEDPEYFDFVITTLQKL